MAMTPQEKANELVDKYYGLVISTPYEDSEDGYCVAETNMLMRLAKQCALIAVDEVMHSLEIYFTEPIPEAFTVMSLRNHWQLVKQEIEKL